MSIDWTSLSVGSNMDWGSPATGSDISYNTESLYSPNNFDTSGNFVGDYSSFYNSDALTLDNSLSAGASLVSSSIGSGASYDIGASGLLADPFADLAGSSSQKSGGSKGVVQDFLDYINNKDHAGVVNLGANMLAGFMKEMVGSSYKKAQLKRMKDMTRIEQQNADANTKAVDQRQQVINNQTQAANAMGETNFAEAMGGKGMFQNVLAERQAKLGV